MNIATLLLAAVHGFFAFGHLSDPAAAVEQMVGVPGASAIVKHCIAIIGASHVFSSVLMLMVSGLKDGGHAKCILGIYLITFIPCTFAIQFMFPANGTAPAGPMEMPLPVLFVMTALAIGGMVLSPKSKNKAE